MSFQVTKKALWESGQSLQRFGLLKFTDKSVKWKAARIHRAAQKANEKLVEDHRETLVDFGAVEVERKDRLGNTYKELEIQKPDDVKKYRAAWEKLLTDKVELPLDPFKPDEFGDELALDTQDIGALSEWLIAGEVEATEPAKAQEVAA